MLYIYIYIVVSLENSLRILHKCVTDGAEKEQSVDEILIPMIEHVSIVFIISLCFEVLYGQFEVKPN